MEFLVAILERVQSRLAEHSLLVDTQPEQILLERELLEEQEAFVSFQAIGKTPYFKFINDACDWL